MKTPEELREAGAREAYAAAARELHGDFAAA
jgi:hypothetical protein